MYTFHKHLKTNEMGNKTTNSVADAILKKLENKNEHHFPAAGRRIIVEAMEEFALTSEFALAVHLLGELAYLQNGAPLESYRESYEKTMSQVVEFLDKYDNELP